MASNKTYSDKQEKLVAKHINGKQISGSGARPFAPGDVESDEWLIECKTHVSPGKKISFKADVWAKIQEEAMVRHKYPAYVVDDGSQLLSNQRVMFSLCPEDISALPKEDIQRFVKAAITFNVEDTLSSSVIYKAFWNQKTVYIVSLKYFEQLFAR